ncbi:hypothetical protein NDU88_004197 [Pleurodeles waltl]|uniref:Uncharacterized protein n=1 Tax=Pleurodeles waltl TaxID=8319 RepID=A0AAV7VFI3_PLEWA|nr:hypothetical protein NDU88_004197 [Pleurodeles waltl]
MLCLSASSLAGEKIVERRPMRVREKKEYGDDCRQCPVKHGCEAHYLVPPEHKQTSTFVAEALSNVALLSGILHLRDLSSSVARAEKLATARQVACK